MKTALRYLAALVVGIISAFVVVTLVEILSGRIYHMPPDVTPANKDAMKAWIAQLPTSAFALVLSGWVLGAFTGGFVAAKMDRTAWARHGIVLGALLLAATVANMLSIPHPTWIWVGAFALIVPGAYLGARTAGR